MEYEKKYKEALERARALRNEAIEKEYAVDYIKDYETIFPELRESEDERIRKWLVDYAIEMIAGLESDISCSAYDGIKGHDPEAEAELAQWQKARAYLEKQKEHKWSPSEGEMGVLYKLCYISNQITDEDDTELTRLYQDLKREYFNGHSFENMFPSEKQKEQKPDDKCKGCNNVKGCINCVDGSEWAHIEEKEQKPAEYLNKDMVYSIMKKLHDLAFSQRILINSDEYKKINEITSDVRSLLDYPVEQKPAEYVNVKITDGYPVVSSDKIVEDSAYCGEGVTVNGEKPSEEQMAEMEFVINDYREDSCNATANYLQEILDHLKNM